MILVDSTKYVSWMRQGRNPVTVLSSYIMAQELVSCGIIRIEVLRGILKPSVRAEMTSLFDLTCDIPLTYELIQEVVDLAWKLDRRGIVLPVTDLIIGTCAKRVDATIVSEDPHFKRIPGLKVQRGL